MKRERDGEVEPLWAHQNQPFKSAGIGGGTAGWFAKFVKFIFWTLTLNHLHRDIMVKVYIYALYNFSFSSFLPNNKRR